MASEAFNAGLSERQLTLAALSGTYNMIDPDPRAREVGAEALNRLIALAPSLGADLVTLCTGSRDPSNMRRKHPDNDTPEAWADLLVQMEAAVRVAEKFGVRLGVEPEIGNTINSVRMHRFESTVIPYTVVRGEGALCQKQVWRAPGLPMADK